MNNNKKYKKWSLGLVAPALVLAPIAVVASCSSSSEDTKIDLTKLVYTIAFKDNNSQEIQLSDQSTNSVDTITNEKLIDLVLTSDNKTNILNITGADATKINDDVLKKQILSIDGEPVKDKPNGKIKFTLKVNNPVNGSGDALTKEITFAGFKKETDSTPPAESEKFKIKFKDEAEFMLENVSDQSVNDFSTGDDLKPIIIKNKEKIFEAEKGTLPGDDWWTEEKLTILTSVLNAANGSVTAKISLDGYDTTETANQENNTLTKEGVILKGFREEAQTEAITEEISTVTLGLNGTVAEVTASNEINAKWVLDNKRLLFKKGFNLIKEEADIKEVNFADAQNKKATLSFKVEANKWFSADGQIGTNEKEITITIKGFPGANTANQLLKNKLNGTNDNPLPISLVDPILGEGTYKDYFDNSATIFTNDFVFKYRKHLLTGDFTQIDKTDKDGFLKVYDDDGKFVKVVPNDSNQTIEIKFTILKDKLVPAPSADKEYSIVFNGFKAPSN